LVANGTLSFEDGLKLVSQRAVAMQKHAEIKPSTMAAVLGLADNVVESMCNRWNCGGQL
jgi:[acyl-carrier-protein] S-malonyltransferase